ncbi:MAG: hypothetical protein ACJ8ER_03050 [Allosphingosinicella sp.]
MKAAPFPAAAAALVLAACSPPAHEENRAATPENLAAASAAEANVSAAGAVEANGAAATMESPAGAPPLSGPDAVLGAIAGPCGSEKAADFMGRAWSPQTEAALKARTGAVAVLILDEANLAAQLPVNPRRVDVLLNSRNQIIHLVCG